MSDVLIGLNKNVAMDCDNIHTDTSAVQNPRDKDQKKNKNKKGGKDDAEFQKEQKEKRLFRLEIQSSVKNLAGQAEQDVNLRKINARIAMLTASFVWKQIILVG